MLSFVCVIWKTFIAIIEIDPFYTKICYNMPNKKFDTEKNKIKNDKLKQTLCLTSTKAMLESTINRLPNRINSFINDVDSQTKYIISKIVVKRAMGIGFLINQEEKIRGKEFSVFWREVSRVLENRGCNYSSKQILFEARVLYLTFKRFTNVIDGYLSIDNISIPLGVSKKHLLLIDRYCISETQQDMFIK